jgi:hypothetical protein
VKEKVKGKRKKGELLTFAFFLLPFSLISEAEVGFEPTNIGLAVRFLAAWILGQSHDRHESVLIRSTRRDAGANRN